MMRTDPLEATVAGHAIRHLAGLAYTPAGARRGAGRRRAHRRAAHPRSTTRRTPPAQRHRTVGAAAHNQPGLTRQENPPR